MTYPTLVRSPRFSDTFPWEYSVAELSSLFGIERTSKLLELGGAVEGVGIVECLWMLECHLRALTITPAYKVGDFDSQAGGLLTNITGTVNTATFGFAGLLNFSITNLNHSSFPIAPVISHWINAIRADMGVPAWNWSADFDNGTAVLQTRHVKEMWYAIGLAHEVAVGLASWPCWASSGAPLIMGSDPCDPAYYRWSNPGAVSVVDTGYAPGGAAINSVQKATISVPEITRIPDVYSIILFRHGGDNLNYTGYGSIKCYHGVDLTPPVPSYEYPNSFHTGTVMAGTVYPVSQQILDGTPPVEHAVAYASFDASPYHPTHGSGAYNYRIQFSDHVTKDSNPLFTFPYYTGKPVWFWQPYSTNPYLEA